MQVQKDNKYRIRTNHQIRVPQIRVIGPDGVQLGIMDTRDALKLAKEKGLDLVEINPKSSPPICKILDYGKFKYEEKRKASESKKNQKVQELKEISFRPTIDEHDLSHKLTNAKQFLSEGNKVKFVVRFRGRECLHLDVGKEKLEWIVKELSGLIMPNVFPSVEGKFMHMIVSPSKN